MGNNNSFVDGINRVENTLTTFARTLNEGAQAQNLAAPSTLTTKNINFNKLRPIVIDGSNVAMQAGRNGRYCCRAILLAAKYFIERGHRVYAFVPKFRRTQNAHNIHKPIDDQWLLEWMENQGLLVLTPSRQITTENGTRRQIVCYDDNMIVQYAHDNGGIILSNDNYRDVSKSQPQWAETIRTKLLMFTWVDEQLMIPVEPLGRDGPKLEEFLQYRPGEKIQMEVSKFMSEEKSRILLQQISDVLKSSYNPQTSVENNEQRDLRNYGSASTDQQNQTTSTGCQLQQLPSLSISNTNPRDNIQLSTNNSGNNHHFSCSTSQQMSPDELKTIVSALREVFPMNVIQSVVEQNPTVTDVSVLGNLIIDSMNDLK